MLLESSRERSFFFWVQLEKASTLLMSLKLLRPVTAYIVDQLKSIACIQVKSNVRKTIIAFSIVIGVEPLRDTLPANPGAWCIADSSWCMSLNLNEPGSPCWFSCWKNSSKS